MSIVHAYDVGNGDMFSIRHGNHADSCTIIDCNISDENKEELLKEIDNQRKGREIIRVISTHPDQDHISGLKRLDDHIQIVNFYSVENKATKDEETEDFKRYKELRDSDKAFKIFRGCSRRWLNEPSSERGGAGIQILWPIVENEDFKKALKATETGQSPNNISPVIQYSVRKGTTMAWFGDLETDFMEKIKDEVEWPPTNIIFAPHHGRDSGKIPKEMLDAMDPKLIIIGEAPSKHLDYYRGYDTITQNSAGRIYFECFEGWTHIYVGKEGYSVDFLENRGMTTYDNYIGSLRA